MHLSLQDIAIDSCTSPTVVRINIKQSKTDPFHKNIQLFLGTTDHTVSPIKGILALRGNKPGPLFITDNNTPLTKQVFSISRSAILTATRLDHHRYSTHRFCIGAATSAKLAGVSELNIKMLERWRSSIFECYIRTSREHLASLLRQLISPVSSR